MRDADEPRPNARAPCLEESVPGDARDLGSARAVVDEEIPANLALLHASRKMNRIIDSAIRRAQRLAAS
jgi:hypothetical protein